SVQLARHGAVRCGLRHHHDRRCPRFRFGRGGGAAENLVDRLGGPRPPDRGRHGMKAWRTSEIPIGIVPVALVLALWQVLAAWGLAPPSLLPSPSAVFVRLAQRLTDASFLQHAAATLFRLFVGFAIAVVIGVTAGLAATGNRTIEAVLKPLVRVL